MMSCGFDCDLMPRCHLARFMRFSRKILSFLMLVARVPTPTLPPLPPGALDPEPVAAGVDSGAEEVAS